MARATRLLLLLVVFALSPRAAWAQRVLLAEPPADDQVLFEAFGRLRAELELQSFEVTVLGGAGELGSAEELERASQARGAFSAIALRRTGDGTTAEVLIVDRVTGKATTRRLRIEDSPNGPTLLAVSAADLLRASLIELEPGERPSKAVVGVEQEPPPPEVVRFAQAPPRLQVRAGALSLFAPELGLGGGAMLGVHHRVGERLSLGLELWGPLVGGEFVAANGVATVRQELALLRAGWNLSGALEGRGWQWGPLVGVGVLHQEARSEVEPPLVAQSATLWALVGQIAVGAQVHFTRALSATAELGVLGMTPRPVIAIDDRRSSPITAQGHAAMGLGVSF